MIVEAVAKFFKNQKQKQMINNHIKNYAAKLKEGQKVSLSSVQNYLRTKGIRISLGALKKRFINLKIKL